jgi:hypothetical protein
MANWKGSRKGRLGPPVVSQRTCAAAVGGALARGVALWDKTGDDAAPISITAVIRKRAASAHGAALHIGASGRCGDMRLVGQDLLDMLEQALDRHGLVDTVLLQASGEDDAPLA